MKSKILEVLINNRGTFTTGQMLSDYCNVSRQSIHKHINSLRQEGYVIKSEQKKGYQLVLEKTLSQASLEILLSETSYLENAVYLEQVNSTNTYLKMNADSLSTALVVADEQTAGRGRMGRVWQSSPKEGLWQSLLLRPSIKPSEASMLTQVAGIAMLEAIEEVIAIPVGIKWPNDLLIENRKVCGILTEMSAELSAVQYVVIGIGLNVNQKSFPEEIRDIASSLYLLTGKEVNRYHLLESFLKKFGFFYQQFLKDHSLLAIRDKLNEKSTLVGKEITIFNEGESKEAFAREVNEKGELIVEDNNGTQTALYYGEVSVRVR